MITTTVALLLFASPLTQSPTERIGQTVRILDRELSEHLTTEYLAFQDGDGPWTAIPVVKGKDDYEAVVTSEDGKYGWLVVERETGSGVST
jgi:hypothetical protein